MLYRKDKKRVALVSTGELRCQFVRSVHAIGVQFVSKQDNPSCQCFSDPVNGICSSIIPPWTPSESVSSHGCALLPPRKQWHDHLHGGYS